jgi:hypothetical protein
MPLKFLLTLKSLDESPEIAFPQMTSVPLFTPRLDELT